MTARRNPPAPRDVEPVDIELYDGRTALGHVRATGDGFRAFDDAGGDLGLFNSEKAAVDAILAARRGSDKDGLAPRDHVGGDRR